MTKMTDYVTKYTNYVKGLNNQNQITRVFDQTKPFYEGKSKAKTAKTAKTAKAAKTANSAKKEEKQE